MSKATPLVVFGEVLYDCFPDGQRVLGGAPFNVAWGLRGFGQSPVFVSAVGEDSDGRAIQQKMNAWGMCMDGLQVDAVHSTGKVQVRIVEDEPNYEICEERAWDFVEDDGWSATQMIYHGLLALRGERTRASFEAIVRRSSGQRFFDVNLRPPYDSFDLIRKWMCGVDWLKLNIDELETLLERGPIDFSDSSESVELLRQEYGIRNVLLTGGRRGARIIGDVGEAACIPAPKPEPFVDTVGAGDSFSAYTMNGLLRGMPLEEIVQGAGRFAAKVCGMQGATTDEIQFYQ